MNLLEVYRISIKVRIASPPKVSKTYSSSWTSFTGRMSPFGVSSALVAVAIEDVGVTCVYCVVNDVVVGFSVA